MFKSIIFFSTIFLPLIDIECCVTVNRSTGNYTVEPSGCVAGRCRDLTDEEMDESAARATQEYLDSLENEESEEQSK